MEIARGLRRAVRRKPLGAVGASLVLLIVLMAALADVAAPYSPTEMHPGASMQPPNARFWLGTDTFGRDILSRLLHGARVSLLIGLGATLGGVVLGASVGLISGYLGGTLDLLVQRAIDVMLAFPLLLLALTVAALLGPATPNVILALMFPLTPRTARVARASGLALRHTAFVEAAVAIGGRAPRIVARHLLPNAVAPLLVLVTAYMGTAITSEAGLSYLGVGTKEPNASWGLMLSDFALNNAREAPWLPIFPGLALSMAGFGFNLLGDAVRDLLDPRLRGLG
jgi:peptide/nickel transport system permease protein